MNLPFRSNTLPGWHIWCWKSPGLRIFIIWLSIITPHARVHTTTQTAWHIDARTFPTYSQKCFTVSIVKFLSARVTCITIIVFIDIYASTVGNKQISDLCSFQILRLANKNINACGKSRSHLHLDLSFIFIDQHFSPVRSFGMQDGEINVFSSSSYSSAKHVQMVYCREHRTKCTGKSVNRARIFFMLLRFPSLDSLQRQQWVWKRLHDVLCHFNDGWNVLGQKNEKISTRDWTDAGPARFRSCKSNWIANAFLLITHNMWHIWSMTSSVSLWARSTACGSCKWGKCVKCVPFSNKLH